MPLGTEVDRGPGHIVLDGVRATDTDTDTDIYWHSCGLKAE